RVDELETLEMRIDRVLGDSLLDPAALDIGLEELDREQVLLREEHQLTAIGGERRGDVELAAAALFGEKRAREIRGWEARRLERRVPLAERRVPGMGQGVGRYPEHALDGRAGVPALARGLQDV